MGKIDCLNPNAYPELVKLHEELNRDASAVKVKYTPKGKRPQTFTVEGDHIFNSDGKEVYKTDSESRRAILSSVEEKTTNGKGQAPTQASRLNLNPTNVSEEKRELRKKEVIETYGNPISYKTSEGVITVSFENGELEIIPFAGLIKDSKGISLGNKDINYFVGALKVVEDLVGGKGDFSYTEGYLPLWQEGARQNPELIKELRQKTEKVSMEDIADYVREFSAKKHIDQNKWTEYKEEALNYVKERMKGNTPDVTPVPQEKPNLLQASEKMINSLQNELKTAFNDKQHEYTLTLSDGSKIKVRHSVTDIASNYSRGVDILSKRKGTTPNIGMVMGNVFDAAIKGAFEFGSVPKLVNLDERSRKAIQQYYDSLKESLDKAYGEGKWKAYTMNLSISGAYKYGENRFALAGTPDIIIATENEWLILDAKTTSHEMDTATMQQYSMQTSMYKRLFEDRFPELKDKIKTGLIVAETNYPKVKTFNFDKEGNLYFGPVSKNYRWDDPTNIEEGVYGFFIKADVNSDLFKSLLKATDYIDMKELESISEEELRKAGLSREDFILDEDDTEGITSAESIIDTDTFLRPVTKKELNDFSRNIMNLYSYYINRLHDENLRKTLRITEEDVKNSDGEYMSLYELKRNRVIFSKILNFIKTQNLLLSWSKMPKNSPIFNKYLWLINNWKLVIQNGNAQLIKNEGISVNLEESKDTTDVTEDILNANNLEEIEESQKDAYNISALEVPITASMSTVLKSMLSTIPIKQWDKRIVDGKPVYEPVAFVYDEWGLPKFYTQEEVILILVNDLAGSVNESDMRNRMEKLAEREPYVRNVIELLDENPDVWPLFYTTFNLMPMEYTEVYRSYDNTTKSKHPMSRKLQDRSVYNKLMSKLKIDIKGNKILLLKVQIGGYIEADRNAVKSLLHSYEKLLSGSTDVIRDKGARKAEWGASALKALGITDPKIIAVSVKYERLIVSALKELRDRRDAFISIEAVTPLYRLYHNIFLEMQLNANKYNSLSVFSKGKNYQRFVASNYVGMILNRMTDEKHFSDEQIKKYIEDTFMWNSLYGYKNGKEWVFYNPFLEALYRNTNEIRRKIEHSIETSAFGKKYPDLSDRNYFTSLISEYYSFTSDNYKVQYCRIPLPVLSDKPASEFISMPRVRFIKGDVKDNAKNKIIENSIGYLYLDIKRIASVIAMLKNGSAEISSYTIRKNLVPKNTLTKINKGKDLTFSDFVDSEGNLREWAANSAASFKQLAFLNRELENKTQFGQYLLDLINGKTVDQSVFIDMFKNAYKADMEQAKQDLISYLGEINYSDSNLIYDLGLDYKTEDEDLNRVFEEFLWNYVYNERNLVNLLIGDPSFYPNTVTLVKRFAQVHSFTNRPDVEATFSTPEGERIRFSDGTQRVLYISDKKIKSEMADALKALFEKKAKEAENAGNINEMNNYKMLAEKATAFRNINVTDGQAFSSPTGFFKKYGMLGMLTPEQKELYWKIKNGTYTAEDLNEGFGIIKPFTYTTMRYSTGTEAMPEIGLPTQIKDSEYMLAFAGLLLKEEPGMDYLKTLYQLMEDSAYTNGKYNGKGIDTILFLSTVKSGETDVIDLEQMEKAKDPLKYLKNQIYDSEGNYTSKVHSFPFSDWGKQQSVPNDLMDGKHAMGSQFRVLNPAELPDNIDITVNGKTYKDKGEFIRDYFTYIADIMQDGYDKMEKLFKLNTTSVKAQNKAASDIIKQSLLKDARYSSELLWAVSLTDGYFNLPLGDNSQTSTLPGMLFSRIKSAINKVPFPGGPAVQVTGYDRDLHIVLRDKNGNKLMGFQEYLDAKGLEEDTQSIAAWNKYLVDNDFSIDYFEMETTCPTEELERKILDGEAITEDERKVLTYRIPTENKYSMFHGRVKKYLPRTSGDVIILPYEITLIAGLDFDVDKLYTIFKYTGKELTEIEKTKNKIFEMQYSILQQGFAMADSMNPGEFESLEQLANLRSPEQFEATNIIYPDKQMIFRKMNMSGKKLVAFAANARVSHAICEMLNLKIKVPDFTVDGININSLADESGFISIGDIYSEFNGRKIARILSEILSAAVDNGKNPVLARIGITPATFNIASTLIRIGVPIEFVSALLLHPKVIQMAADAENSGVNIEDIIDREFKAYAKELNMSSKDYLKFIHDINFTTEDFVNSIRSENPLIKNETVVGFLYNLIPAISNMKRVMFWTRLNSTSNAVNADIYRDLVYEMQLNDFYSQTDDIENIDPQISLSKEQLFTYMPYLRVLSNVYTELLPNLCGNLFPQYSKDFRNLLYTLTDTLGIPYEKLNSRLLKRIFNQYQVFLATKDLIDGSERGRRDLMFDLPKNLVNVSTNIKNYFLENLLVIDKGEGQIPEIYAEKVATKEDLDELIASWETLTLYENKEHPNTERAVNNLSEKLISYAIMKTGMAWHPRGILHLAPNKAKMRYGGNTGYRRLTDPNSDLWHSSRNNTETPLMFLNFIRMFARNNPEVLTVPMSYIEAVAENAFLSSRPDVSIRGEEVSVKRSFYDRNIPGTLTITDADSIWVINSVSDNYVTYKKTKPLSSNFMEYDYHEDAFSMASIETYDINEDSIKMDEDMDLEYYEHSISSSDYSPEFIYNVVSAVLGGEVASQWREGNKEVIRDTKDKVLEALKEIKNPTEIEEFVEEKIKELCQ